MVALVTRTFALSQLRPAAVARTWSSQKISLVVLDKAVVVVRGYVWRVNEDEVVSVSG